MRARMKSNRHAKVTKARQLVAKTLLLATVQSPESMTKDNAAVTKRKFTDSFGISQRAICRQLDMPLATMQHEMKTTTDTRDAMKKKKKDAYVIMKPDKIQRALTDSEIEEL